MNDQLIPESVTDKAIKSKKIKKLSKVTSRVVTDESLNLNLKFPEVRPNTRSNPYANSKYWLYIRTEIVRKTELKNCDKWDIKN